MNFLIRGIPSTLVDHFWKLAEPYVKRALDHANGEFLPGDLRERCKEQLAQLWLVTKGDKVVAAGITEIVVYPRKKHCRIITLAGSQAGEWMEFASVYIEQWALAQGCDCMEAITRKGFVPKLQNRGYTYKQAILVKELLHDRNEEFQVESRSISTLTDQREAV